MTERNNQLDLDLNVVDLSESDLFAFYPDVLKILLRDNTTERNIFWATDNYEDLGDAYTFKKPIMPELITGKNGNVIRPRVKKEKNLQLSRVRKRAEVFTPSWICNKQNNLVDAAWFGRENVFNIEHDRSWETVAEKITFPKGKSWKEYIHANCLEITCGEAPYLASRYDTTTGEFIPLERRIGLLDRKLRVVNENTDDPVEWLRAAVIAYQSIYGYEWQGDSLLLARESLLCTFLENYRWKFGRLPFRRSIRHIAHIISWNLWQMDGLKGVIPESCKEEEETVEQRDMFDDFPKKRLPCPGCRRGSKQRHNGTYARIRDWSAKTELEYISLLEDPCA